ncbi:MAG: acetylglutamate kinase [Chloroflexi bacterium]|nr:acetylglutamate kinase [Chloroflexota bacterium]
MEPQLKQSYQIPQPGRQPLPQGIIVRPAIWDDVSDILEIQNQGIEDRIATLEQELHTFDDQAQWFRTHGPGEPIFVAEYHGQVIGWASLNRFSDRKVYGGVKELSIYVERTWRGRGLGSMILGSLIDRASQLNIYKIVLNALPFNERGLALYRKFGFRTVGVWKSQGKLDNQWVDMIAMEKHLSTPLLDKSKRMEASASAQNQGGVSTGSNPWRAVIVKIGGSTLGAHDTTLKDLVTLQRRGIAPIVIHGGGKIITEWMEKQGVRPRFVRGLRVTDAHSLDIVVAVLTGLINKSLVASITALGGKAVGISGVDGGLLQAEVLDPDLGMVGKIVKVNPGIVHQILDSGSIPVIAPVALHWSNDPEKAGTLLNVNADSAAGEIAASLEAERLLFLTDVEGVLDSSRRLIPRLTPQQAKGFISSGMVAGGMIPKVEACLRALEKVPVSQIIDGRKPKAILEFLEGKSLGTRVG